MNTCAHCGRCDAGLQSPDGSWWHRRCWARRFWYGVIRDGAADRSELAAADALAERAARNVADEVEMLTINGLRRHLPNEIALVLAMGPQR